MTESSWTSGIVSYLKDNGCMTFKHADGFTTGVPDVSSTVNFRTTWLEMKLIKKGEKLWSRVKENKIQYDNMLILSRLGRAYYIIRMPNGIMYAFNPVMFFDKLSDEELLKGGVIVGNRQILDLVRAV